MWFLKRDPWIRINRELKGLIHYLDTDAAVKFADQGKDDEALEARLVAIRLAVMFRDRSTVESMVSRTEELLDKQRAAGISGLQTNGLTQEEREDKRLRLDVRDQVARCFIQIASAA